MPTDPAAVYDVIDAWRNEGPRPVVHRVAQQKLRRDWPALASALDRLCAHDGDGQVSRMLTCSELNEITDRYRVSPWDQPPRIV